MHLAIASDVSVTNGLYDVYRLFVIMWSEIPQLINMIRLLLD